MSRVCDFCDASEHEVRKMVERKAEERRSRKSGDAHICLDCAKLAVEVLEQAMRGSSA